MSSAVQSLLTAFNALSETDKHDAAIAILKEALPSEPAELSDIALCEIADELFQEMDQCESENAQS